MRDFLPDDVRRRAHVIAIIAKVYERYGFEPLETPAVENIETLLGKYGDEGNQLIFKILKRGEHEASGQADLALRYDLTVPLARVVAQYQSQLPRLFKRYQIQPVWRADRPARGRFREFYQCDVDALGSTSPVVEAELCAAVSDALIDLGFDDFVVRINHRQLLTSMLSQAGVAPEQHARSACRTGQARQDRRGRRVGRIRTARHSCGGAASRCSALFGAGRQMAGARRSLDAIAEVVQDEAGRQAVENLTAILALTSGTGAEGKVRFDPSLARGLSYYTGAIMEINVADLAGSLGGGGRYDNLVGMFLGQNIPACGFSLGLERILVVMGERKMFPPALDGAPADVMLATFDASGIGAAMRLAVALRRSGLRVLVYPDAEKIGKQIKYADSRGIPFVGAAGRDEIAAGAVTVKNLATQTQATYDQSAAGAAILEGLRQRG